MQEQPNPKIYASLATQIFLATILLLAVGTVMIHSTSALFADRSYGDAWFFTKRHLVFLVVGFLVMLLATFYPHAKYRKLTLPFMIFVFVLLLLVLIPGIGHKVSGARRWIRFLGVGIQPAELLKLAMIFWTADFLSRKKDVLMLYSRGFLPNLLVWGGPFFLLLLQPDLGTTVLLCVTLLVLLFIAGVRKFHALFTFVVFGIVSAGLVVNNLYRMRRITAFLNPWQDPHDVGYQLVNSLIAYGSGGIVGRGFGQSLQKQYFLPHAHTDFLFAILAEETGIWGILFVLGLYCWFLFLGFALARRCNEDYSRYLCIGISILLILQAWLHVSVVSGLLPTKGIGLPLVSYGGSSLVVFLWMVGILLNICRSHSKP